MLSTTARLLAGLGDLAALSTRGPGLCEVCRGWGAGALCAACIARYAAPQPRCGRCGLRLVQPAPACGDCLRAPPPWRHTVCVADYGYPWDRLIAAFKFEGRVELAAALAARLVEAGRAAAAPLPQVLVAVPLAPARLAERGYDQAWELARRAARGLGLAAPVAALQRPLDGSHQADLGRAERLRNLRRAFLVDPAQRSAIRGRSVGLVDDVLTTGATAREATEALLRAGAAAVDIWVVARTPA